MNADHNSDSTSQQAAQAAVSRDALVAKRRRMLKLVAGGVPLMSTLPAGAQSLAISSAWRAARYDATQRPPAMASAPDGWIRQRVEVVRCTAATTSTTSTTTTTTTSTTTATATTPFNAYKIGTGTAARYHRIPDMARVDLAALGMQDAGPTGTYAHALVLFDNSGNVIGIDPTRTAGSGGLQGLHCSSWSSISGSTFPGCRSSGFGV